EAFQSLLSGEGSQSAPAGHGRIDIPRFERTERGENELQNEDLGLQIEERDDDPGSISQICNLQSAIFELTEMEELAVPLVVAFFASGAGLSFGSGWRSDGQKPRLSSRGLRQKMLP